VSNSTDVGASGAVDIRYLSVHYPDRRAPALRSVSEGVNPGELVVVTGPSGCGKSTLARTLAGFIPSLIPARVDGEVRIGPQEVQTSDLAGLSATIGLVQQDPESQVCTLQVWQEVAFGPQNLCLSVNEIDRRVDQALRVVGIEHLASRDTRTLSGGEKQRLAIASILAMEPQILVLDEPTSNLDPQAAKRILDTLSDLQRQREQTLLVIEHRLAPFLSMSPRVWVMDQGRIVLRRPTRQRQDLVEMGLRTGWPRRPDGSGRKGPTVVELSRLTFGYQDEPVLSNLDLSVASGEILGLIGPNGGGKTTLLRLLAGLETPRSGDVQVKSDRVGMLFQHPHQQIFERTVRLELEIDGPLSDEGRGRLLAGAHLDGLDGAAPLSLSLGEQRRLTLATTLRRDPFLLLLDEPFIGQDRHNAAWMIGSILSARDRGAAIVLVSHDISLVGALADRILYLGDDAIVGPPRDVFCRLREGGQTAFTPDFWEEGA